MQGKYKKARDLREIPGLWVNFLGFPNLQRSLVGKLAVVEIGVKTVFCQ